MKQNDYIPNSDAALLVWYDNFTSKLPAHAPTLSITPAEVTQFQTDLTTMRANINTVAAAKSTLQSSVQSKEAVIAISLKRLRDAVGIMKRRTAYTETIGEDLGIIPSASEGLSPLVRANAKPEFQATILADMVRLDWIKAQFDGVVVQGRRGAEATFTTLDKDNKSPYDDRRTNITSGSPETRLYRMRYLVDDEEVGGWSDDVRVVCLI